MDENTQPEQTPGPIERGVAQDAAAWTDVIVGTFGVAMAMVEATKPPPPPADD